MLFYNLSDYMLINNYNNVYIIEIKIYLYFTTKLLYRYIYIL